MFFLDQAWLVPLVPAVSFVIILLFGRRLPRKGSEVGIAAVGFSFLWSCAALAQWVNHIEDVDSKGAVGILGALGKSVGHVTAEGTPVPPVVHHYTWFQNAGFKLGVGIQIDGLAVMMMFVVTLISLLVHVFSTEYLHGDRRFTSTGAIVKVCVPAVPRAISERRSSHKTGPQRAGDPGRRGDGQAGKR